MGICTSETLSYTFHLGQNCLDEILTIVVENVTMQQGSFGNIQHGALTVGPIIVFDPTNKCKNQPRHLPADLVKLTKVMDFVFKTLAVTNTPHSISF